MNYQQLDKIADAYVPTLIIITIIWYTKRAFLENTKSAIYYDMSATFLGVIFIYLAMYIDSRLKIYSSIGLDYSTHTALALVFITALSFIGVRFFWVAISSMILYIALMLYQEYHTSLDILLTTLNVLPILVWLHIKARQFKNVPA